MNERQIFVRFSSETVHLRAARIATANVVLQRTLRVSISYNYFVEMIKPTLHRISLTGNNNIMSRGSTIIPWTSTV